jgi:hypothetical protein
MFDGIEIAVILRSAVRRVSKDAFSRSSPLGGDATGPASVSSA